jgi:YVTN family beta-propeller protein
LAFGALIGACTVGSACSDGLTGNAHPTDRVNYPLSVTADPSGRLIWVVSGNFDLAYRGAAVLGYDVVDNRFLPELAFEVGSFPGPFKLLERDGQAVAGFIASRSENTLYSVTLSGDPTAPTVACADGERADPDGILRCRKSGAISTRTVSDSSNSVKLTVGDDPYNLAIRKSKNGVDPDLLLVGGMADGRLAQLSINQTGVPTLIGQFDLSKGLYGLVENPATGRVYASSKLASALSVLEVARREKANEPGVLELANPYLRLVASVSIPEPAVVRDRARDLAISKDGTRLYATYRTPDSFITLDIADDGRGNPRNRVLNKIAMANDPTAMAIHEVDGQELVYVSCFRDDRVEVVDPIAGQVIASIKTGAGPSGLTVVDRPDLGVRRLYVALFTDQAIGVIDLDPASPFYHTEIAEIR